MIFLQDRAINQPVTVLVEGSVSSGDAVKLYVNNSLGTAPVSATPLSPVGPSSLAFTPNATGLHTLVLADGTIAAVVDVVTRTSTSYLKNIEDEALGSWTWDKTEGTLSLLRQDGSGLADFAVVDTVTQSSRERLL